MSSVFKQFQKILSGLSLTAVTVATDDKVLIQDTSDSNNLKTVTAQSIADLGGGGGGGTVFGYYFDKFGIGTSTSYQPITMMYGNASETSSEARVKGRFPVAGTIQNLSVKMNTHPGGTVTVRIRKNGANGNSVANSTTTGLVQDTSNTDSVTTSDDINFSIVGTSSSTGAMFVVVTCEFVPS